MIFARVFILDMLKLESKKINKRKITHINYAFILESLTTVRLHSIGKVYGKTFLGGSIPSVTNHGIEFPDNE